MNNLTQQVFSDLFSYGLVFLIFGLVVYIWHLFDDRNAHIEKLALVEAKQLNVDLEQRIKERTNALEQVTEELKRDIARREQVERELIASESRQRAIFNAEPDAMLISNTQGIIVMANQQAERLLGYCHDEFVGQSIEMFMPKQFRANHVQHRQHYNEAPYIRPMANGFNGVAALHKDGSRIDVEISLSPIETDLGLLFASALRDIRHRKQADVALRASEERFRLMANHSPVMIWITDQDGNPTFANRAWLDFVGLSSAQAMSSEDWQNAVHPDDIKTAFVNYYANIQAREPIATEYRLRHVSGDWRWVFDQGVPMFDDAGEFVGYIGSLIDITEHKRIEAELRVAATAFESHEAMIITDANSVILRINAAFSEITGYSAEEAIGRKMNLLRSGRHDEAFYEAMWDSIKRNGSWRGEIWDRRKNGEIYPKWLTITAVTDDKGIVTHYVGTQSDITERKEAEKKIRHLAYYDPLTQLANRRLLQERIDHAISVGQRDNQLFALLMLDLDRFKAVNDSFGHLVGDELLQKVAIRLTTRLRSADSIARLGGDEFVILLENLAHSEDAARVAEHIVKDLSRPFQLAQHDNVRIGVSIGISLYPQHGDNPSILMEQVDAALYQAKAKGRGCFAYFSDELTQIARERMILEARLRIAIAEQQLRVFYQPQIDIASNQLIGAEALVRWQDPTNGLIPPNKFISIAEESGLILALGEWVLRETCRQGRQWLDDGLPAIHLAVNVSPQQFKQQRNIAEVVASILEETRFPASLLELEITENGLMECAGKTDHEGATMESKDNAVYFLDQLRQLGIRLAIDDFGTGYSSLAYLKRFPLDVLKIDKGFIDTIPNDKNDMAIAATIIEMAHILGFQVLAEGVETAEQLAFLQNKGCDSYQGYYKSRPLPAEQFEQLLKDYK